MSNQWFRVWHGMNNDPKFRTIARISEQPVMAVICVYMHALEKASENEDRGSIKNLRAEDVASALDIETEQVEQILDAMQGRVINGEKLSGWDKRQPVREDDSSSRVKSYRARKSNDKKEDVTQCNAHVTQCNAPDTDTDTDTDKQITPSAPNVKTKSPVIEKIPLKSGGEKPITADVVDEYSKLYPSLDVVKELRAMRAWCISNPAKQKTKAGVMRFVNGWLAREQDSPSTTRKYTARESISDINRKAADDFVRLYGGTLQ